MRKRLLSLALALVLCMGLTVPAMAATVTELDPDENYGEWRKFSEGLAAVRSKGKGWGYIDAAGKFVIPCQYSNLDAGRVGSWNDACYDFSDGVVWVNANSQAWENGEIKCLDKTGSVLFTLPDEYHYWAGPEPFSDGFARVLKDGKYGYIDKTGQEVIPCQYSRAGSFSEGLAAVYNAADGYWGYIDKSGSITIPFQYESAERFSDSYTGYAVVHIYNRGTTLIDKTGRDVIPSGYSYDVREDSGWESGDRYVPLRSSDGKRDSVYDLTTGQIVKFPFDVVSDFQEGFAQAKENGMYLFINENYEAIISPGYGGLSDFSGGYALRRNNDVVSVIDQTGRVFLTVHNRDENSKYEVGKLSEGLLTAFSSATGRMGFIDVTGREVVPCKYKKVEEFHNGVAAVQNFEDKWGLVDTSGNEIVPCEHKIGIKYLGGIVWALFMSSDYQLISISGTAPYSTAAPTTPSTPAQPAGPSANPTNSKVLVNGKEVAFDAYTIDGSNYFKLRDLAFVLNSTEKQFEVGWDNASKTITLTSGSAYTANGSEMAKGSGAQSASVSASKLLIDGKEVSLTAYTIGGNNYFKLRDIGQAFDFGIGWDNATKTITIDTSAGYTA